MKQIATLLMILLFSQITLSQNTNDSYEKLWSQVKKLENDALTKSALSVVISISNKAKRENNSPQIVKTLLYTSKYALTLEEDAQLKIINNFKSEIKNTQFPTKNILESYLATLYWQYFQQNQYQFYNRTKTKTKVDANDFRTWDLNTLFKEISTHFDASLQNEKELKQTGTTKFEMILNLGTDSEAYRPTLFDLLAYNALVFYTSSENNITRPADKFEINPDFMCNGTVFIKKNISSKDETSLQVKALAIYQKLLALHQKSAKPYAYAQVDIERLDFIYKNATFENKEQQLLDVLQNSTTSAKQSLAASLYQYKTAELLNQLASNYHPKTKEENRWKKKEALAICTKVIKNHPDSRSAMQCEALQTQILQKELQLTVEKNISISTTARILVQYKNLDSLSLSAYTFTQSELKVLNRIYEKDQQLAFIKKLAVVKTWNTNLKNENDYQTHSTEIAIPPLENGQYLILAEPKKPNNQAFSYNQIQVTDLAIAETRSNTHHNFQVINRNTGKPVSEAKLNFQYKKNYTKNRLTKHFTTDKLGNISIPLSQDNWSDVDITVTHKKDKAYYHNYYLNRRYDRNETAAQYTCFLFTDRSIYRPGQTLFFKGIAIKQENKNSTILEKQKVNLKLNDANGQTVATAEFITNEYGSFSGEFILPNNGLTGAFSIIASAPKSNLHGYANFSVEEYKRPKFETSFNPVTETYKINDSVIVKGLATAYAGSKITDAKVSYRVKRAVYFPRWYYWHHPYNNTSPQEIAHGETTTDALGNYEINFKALADTSIDRKNLPTFTYEVTADVTDINGETQSTTTQVTVGYHALTANMTITDPIDKNAKENKLSIVTNNLNGQFVPAKGSIKMHKLIAPETVNRPRPWEAPDFEGWTKAEFKNLFPHDAYGSEQDVSTWKKGTLVWQADFDTEKSKEILLKNTKNWASGKYVIELESKDKFDQPVKDIVQTTLYSSTDKKLVDNSLFEIKTDKTNYEIGDTVKVTLLSSSNDLHVTVNIEKEHQIIDTKVIHLTNNSESFTVPVNRADLGGFAISYSYAAYNHFKAGNLPIKVPYPSSDLEIETLTFRDKLQPGVDETWSFKIKGPKGDKVTAELLASMYDASLDTFRGHSWSFNPLYQPIYYASQTPNAYRCFEIGRFNTYLKPQSYGYAPLNFNTLNWFGLHFGYGTFNRKLYDRSRMIKKEGVPGAAPVAMEMKMNDIELEESVSDSLSGMAAGTSLESDEDKSSYIEKNKISGEPQKDELESVTNEIQIRKNLQENAFFFPHLTTDKEGNVSFSFTTPEALTKWNFQLLAHTKNLESRISTLQTVTQKELMVIPNAPRFLREGDEIVISTKIANLTEKKLNGSARLSLTDGVTGKVIYPFIGESGRNYTIMTKLTDKEFSVDSRGNIQVSWRLSIPENVQAIQYSVTAKAGDFSDGEQNMLPVLSNRMLVTETLPMWVRGNQTKTFTLDKLKTTSSTTLKHHKLSLEITSNPAWYAVQALPYLMEYPYECNEQTFSKYYANTLATHIANNNPRIQDVFKQWANSDALVSNLEKNEELKSLLIQETPWLRDAQSETEQKKRIALMFNLNKMKNEQANALNKLKQNQKNSGAWPWFNGGPDSRSVTQHIIAGLGHLKQLNVTPSRVEIQKLINNAMRYLDNEFVNEYNQMKKHTKDINADHLSQTQIHYLYMRSFFKHIKTSKQVDEITVYYHGQAKKYWKNKSLYSKGMLALIMHRNAASQTAEKILLSLEENSITSEELGMYWKANTSSWHWYQAPIETQALLIEAFAEIHPKDVETIDNLKIWLLKNKQTNQWKTTKATTEAVYALLLQGNNWLSVTDAVDVLIGGQKIDAPKLENVKVEAGTGYYKTAWNGREVTPTMSEVQITKKGEGIAWGALYWQYFEDLDKTSSAETPIKLKKKLFLKKNTNTGEEISEITSKTDLKVGNMVRVRIELRADREMEFVHMKDMRAAGFEPVNVISRYKWQDGLGYYEATKDASTNFFFDRLPKGVYVFEYDLRVNNAGNFSNGITTIQSMYAPEFSSHSEGIRVKVGS